MNSADEPERPGRLQYIDSIRIVLSALVILHHAAQAFGLKDWWYVEGQPKVQWFEIDQPSTSSTSASQLAILRAQALCNIPGPRQRWPGMIMTDAHFARSSAN